MRTKALKVRVDPDWPRKAENRIRGERRSRNHSRPPDYVRLGDFQEAAGAGGRARTGCGRG